MARQQKREKQPEPLEPSGLLDAAGLAQLPDVDRDEDYDEYLNDNEEAQAYAEFAELEAAEDGGAGEEGSSRG